ncbi:YccF family protein [Rhizobium sp. 16-449-1b]|uniref:YccF family protein n=1 Tax=Rhizobium sp. 16-449-1b TaxID=2819989 RepID=UPI001ADD2529|nr:YccF family protein [Rhizobium sp. 16-449-1b]MBO9193461.1 YccF family protein [Rhizobium sp. 16-449-1b]
MRTGANFLWFILGGWALALMWWFAAALMTISIIGLPWARACWEIGLLSLWPFGRDVVSHAELTGKSSAGLTLFRLIANIIWLPFGVMLAISHVLHGCLMFVTIIGIPLGLQDFKLAGISLFPVGKRVVTKELMAAARSANAQAQLAALRQG